MADKDDSSERQLNELLQELRVALPGVQVLLAFLLTAPFNSRFEMLGQTDRFLFFVGVIAAAAASILMIAPSAHHRFAWPVGTDEMERLLAIGTTEARGGLLALGVAITASVYVVADVIFGGLVPVVTAGVLGTWLGALWVVLPLSMKGSRTGRPKR